jgi:hypothetical protein
MGVAEQDDFAQFEEPYFGSVFGSHVEHRKGNSAHFPSSLLSLFPFPPNHDVA